MFDKKIKYCINRIENLLIDSKTKCDEFVSIIEEEALFNSNINSNELVSKCYHKRRIFASKIYYQQMILNELKNINTFKRASGESERCLSRYGSLYCGDGILYYSDTLLTYNDEQFLEIILNHISHYLHECVSNSRNDIIVKSNCLLSLYHLGLIDYKIAYSNKHRSSLYNKYSKIIDDYILFPPNKNYKKFIINNVVETNFYKVYENEISGVNLKITESNITTNIFYYPQRKQGKLVNQNYEIVNLMKKLNSDIKAVIESINVVFDY